MAMYPIKSYRIPFNHYKIPLKSFAWDDGPLSTDYLHMGVS